MLTRYGQPMIVLEYNHCLEKGSLEFIWDTKRHIKIKDEF